TSSVVRLWDIQKRTLLRTYAAPTGYVGQLLYSPDGRTLLGSYGAMAYAWSSESAKLLHQITAGDKYVHHVTFSPDGRIALSGAGPGYPYGLGPDGKTYLRLATTTINLVEAETGKILKPFSFDEQVYTCSFAPDGRHVSVALVTGPVYVLRLDKPPELTSGK